MDFSPKYLMDLAEKVEKKIWGEYGTYKKVFQYIDVHHKNNGEYNMSYEENFSIAYKDDKREQIDLNLTLHNIKKDDPQILLNMAAELEIETPHFIPYTPLFLNELKVDYTNAYETFQRALKQVQEYPDMAVSSANSALESIVKHILNDENLSISQEQLHNQTLSSLIDTILKAFKLNEQSLVEVRNASSSLAKACKNINDLRNRKTHVHGKIEKDYVIDDPLYAYFIVNATTTIGLFLMCFYEKKYKQKQESIDTNDNSIPEINYTSEIKPEDLPF